MFMTAFLPEIMPGRPFESFWLKEWVSKWLGFQIRSRQPLRSKNRIPYLAGRSRRWRLWVQFRWCFAARIGIGIRTPAQAWSGRQCLPQRCHKMHLRQIRPRCLRSCNRLPNLRDISSWLDQFPWKFPQKNFPVALQPTQLRRHQWWSEIKVLINYVINNSLSHLPVHFHHKDDQECIRSLQW